MSVYDKHYMSETAVCIFYLSILLLQIIKFVSYLYSLFSPYLER